MLHINVIIVDVLSKSAFPGFLFSVFTTYDLVGIIKDLKL